MAGIREIPLTQGKVAIVDEEDYKRVTQFSWFARYTKHCGLWYAMRTCRKTGQRTLLLHRFILDAPTGMFVDHVNGNPLDNRRDNLRLCSHAENCRNAKKKSGSSRYKGVHWYKPYSKWVAAIKVDGRKLHLGYFTTEEEAHAAYCAASVKYHGEFGRTA